jgi:hypothetical protein
MHMGISWGGHSFNQIVLGSSWANIAKQWAAFPMDVSKQVSLITLNTSHHISHTF